MVPGARRGRFDAADTVGALAVAKAVGVDLDVSAAVRALAPGHCPAWRLFDGTEAGYVGELHPKVVAALDLSARAVAGELDVDVLSLRRGAAAGPRPVDVPRRRTPTGPRRRRGGAGGGRRERPRAGAGPSLESLVLFDIHRRPGGEGRKSLAFRLTFPVRRAHAEDRGGQRPA